MKIEEFFQSLNKDELDEIKNIDKELIESDREWFLLLLYVCIW